MAILERMGNKQKVQAQGRLTHNSCSYKLCLTLMTKSGPLLESEDFLAAVAKRRGSVASVKKAGTHLIDEGIKMGARIISVDLD